MAKIKFIPVCSACGVRINGTVDCTPVELQGASNCMPVELQGASNCMRIFNAYVITPPYCSSCGETFEAIEMYTRLPCGGESE